MVRPEWSSGILVASPTPVSWHIRQLSRPSKVCGIAVGFPVDVGVGVGAGAGVGVGVGVGVVGVPPQEIANRVRPSISIANQPSFRFFFICFTPVSDII